MNVPPNYSHTADKKLPQKKREDRVLKSDAAYNILKKYMIKNATWNEKISQTLVKVCSIPSVRKINIRVS